MNNKNIIVLKIHNKIIDPKALPKNNWYLVIGANFSVSIVLLSISLVAVCVINPKPVRRIETHNIPDLSITAESMMENFKDIRIISDKSAEGTMPCNVRNSTLNSFFKRTKI